MSRSSSTSAIQGNGSLDPGFRAPDFAPDFAQAEEQIRVLLRTHLPHGTKAELGRLTGQQQKHISAQFAGESGLRHKTVQAGIWLLSQDPEVEAVAAAIRLILAGADGFELRERRGVTLEFTDGQLCLPGVRA